MSVCGGEVRACIQQVTRYPCRNTAYQPLQDPAGCLHGAGASLHHTWGGTRCHGIIDFQSIARQASRQRQVESTALGMVGHSRLNQQAESPRNVCIMVKVPHIRCRKYFLAHGCSTWQVCSVGCMFFRDATFSRRGYTSCAANANCRPCSAMGVHDLLLAPRAQAVRQTISETNHHVSWPNIGWAGGQAPPLS